MLIIELKKREVIPAIGCTEASAVAWAVTHARELLGTLPDRIEVNLSANVLKNSLGVAIPGTSMMGLPIAIALGALIGKSEYGLEVLKDVTEESVIEGEKLISDKRISISVKEDISEKLFIEAIAYFNNSK